ncbi:virulence-associated V antigen [Vibrio bivalvicida]|uniref:Type III secretion cytoplasmic LcrG inhibitor n=1 Tax=Vibrio bivalvicida TaxID=1276888 RepID=A0A177XUM5_9VIBR|nr:virulence-associated V antigen [Vibrio bivalvicida]OAJ92066.1 hypothetical protein APB76_22170 [Vibrio bivalvicida]
MTDMLKITGSNTGASTDAQSNEAPKTSVNFESELKGQLSGEQFALVQPFIGRLPPIKGKTPEETATLYAAAVKNLADKQAAVSGNTGSALTQWVNSLQGMSRVTSSDPLDQSNQVLSNQFQDWFSKQLTSQLDSFLPTGVVSQFKLVLGSTVSQADQIGGLTAADLQIKTGEVSTFITQLKDHLNSDLRIRNDSLPFLRSAFGSLANRSLTLSEIKDSEFLLKADRFSQKVSEQLVKQFKDAGVTLSKDDADKIAAKIKWTPGMSETQLETAVKKMVTQLKGQFDTAYEANASTRLKAVIDAEVTRLGKTDSKAESLSDFFANIAVSLTHSRIDVFYNDDEIHSDQKTQINADQVTGVKDHVERDIRDLFEKMMRGEPVEPAFKDRYAAMVDNLNTLTARLRRVTSEELARKEINAGHSMTARDLLSVVDASIANRFDEQVLFSLNERRVNRLEKRDSQKAELQSYTGRLKIYGEVQSLIHTKQSGSGTYGQSYNPKDYTFSREDFNYSTDEEFYNSPEFKHLTKVYLSENTVAISGEWQDINNTWIDWNKLHEDRRAGLISMDEVSWAQGHSGKTRFHCTREYVDKYIKPEYRDDVTVNSISGARRSEVKVTHLMFLKYEGVDAAGTPYQDGEKVKKLSNFSSSISDKSKLLNDEVQIKTTELNDTSSQYNSTVEAINKFVQKYHSILEQILRAI